MNPIPLNRTLIATAVLATLAACGGADKAAPDTAPPAATAPDAGAAAEAEAKAQAEAEAKAAEAEALAQREAELKQREADVALKEREAEIAKREAELARKEAAAKRAATAPRPAATAANGGSATSTPPKPTPKAEPIVVPAGARLPIELVAAVSTKTAKVGDPVEAKLREPVTVDGKVALPAGTLVRGKVTRVVSGSQVVGGTPTLGLDFEELRLADGRLFAVHSSLRQQGQDNTGRDAAKIAGGAIIGGIVGHQVDDDKGKVVGAILGGAIGAAAAKKTGTEVELAAGAALDLSLDQALTVTPK